MPAKGTSKYTTPTPTWVERRTSKGESEEEALASWLALTPSQRNQRWVHERKKPRLLAAAKAKVEAGIASFRIANHAARGGKKMHDTPEEAATAQLESNRLRIHRQSQDRLEFRREHAKGCSVEGCPLAPPEEGESPVILSLLEHLHVDPKSKVDSVTKLTGEARMEELEKTQCLCLWHAFVRIRESRGFRPFGCGAAPGDQRQLTMQKESAHCEHPHHAAMPYASLVPRPDDDPLVHGFLDVSHVLRGGDHRHASGEDRVAQYFDDIASGAAVIHCTFCHALWTLAENAHLSDTPFVQQQYRLLPVAFVEHFKQKTAGFDWDAERARLGALISKANTGKKKPRKQKRKREDEEAEEDMEDG
jgi:hypothetical protein